MISPYDLHVIIFANKVVHRAVNACLAPIASVHMCSVITVEGIGSTSTRLHAVQQALVDNHGTQCGFCTPGIVMSMYTLVRNVGRPTEEMIERALQDRIADLQTFFERFLLICRP